MTCLSALRTRLVLVASAALVAGVLPGSASAADYSGTCTSPTARIADGYVGSTYVTLRAQTNPTSPSTTWVCFRIGGTGGRFDIAGAAVSPGAPSVDESSHLCSQTAGNAVPGPHPAVDGFVGPVTYMVDTYANAGTAWVCLSAAGVERRVVVPVPGVTAPSVDLLQDSPPNSPPDMPGPVGYPSSGCQEGTLGTSEQRLNMRVQSARASLFTAQSGSRVHVCARIANAPVIFGGLLTVDAATPSPVVTQGTDFTPCTVPLAGTAQPAVTYLAVSPAGANPASVCVQIGTTKQRVTVGTIGGATVVPPTFTRDPDSL